MLKMFEILNDLKQKKAKKLFCTWLIVWSVTKREFFKISKQCKEQKKRKLKIKKEEEEIEN